MRARKMEIRGTYRDDRVGRGVTWEFMPLASLARANAHRLSPFATPIIWRTAQSQWEHGKSEQVEHWEHGHHDLWPLLMKEHSQG